MGMILQSMVMMRDESGVCIAKKYICLHMSETAIRWQKVNNHILMKREKDEHPLSKAAFAHKIQPLPSSEEA